MPINQKGVFNPWLVLVFGGILLGGVVLSGQFNSWLNLPYQDSRTSTEQPTAIVSQISSSSPTPEAVKKEGDLNGLWEGYGYKFNGSHNVNSLVLTSVDKNKEIVKGTVSKNAFTGTLYLEAKGCPNLDKTISANGTVSSEIISLKYRSVTFDIDSCIPNGPNTERDYTVEYTKINE